MSPLSPTYARSLPNVVYVGNNLFTCSADTQDLIAQKIREHDLNRVVIAACTPRTHEPLFQDTLREAGLNPYLVEMANIRNHNSWVHQKMPEKATAKAKYQVRMAVAKVSPGHAAAAALSRCDPEGAGDRWRTGGHAGGAQPGGPGLSDGPDRKRRPPGGKRLAAGEH